MKIKIEINNKTESTLIQIMGWVCGVSWKSPGMVQHTEKPYLIILDKRWMYGKTRRLLNGVEKIVDFNTAKSILLPSNEFKYKFLEELKKYVDNLDVGISEERLFLKLGEQIG